MRVDFYPAGQRSSVVVEAIAFGCRDRNCAAQVRIQEAEDDKQADRRECWGAEIPVVDEVGNGGGGELDRHKGVVVEAGAGLVRDSIAALDDSRGLDWGASRSQVEAAYVGTQLDCETLARGAAVGTRREVAIRRKFAMRDQHPALPSKLRFDLREVGGIEREA